MTDFVTIPRAAWATRVASASPGVLGAVAGIEPDELREIYAPLASLLASRVRPNAGTLIVGIAGSVAVGKSTASAALRQLLANTWSVEIVSTDGFLLSNAELEERNLVMRKGFPESYDTELLVATLHAVRAGQREVVVPRYDHRTYDVIGDRHQTIARPNILLLEGVNALASPAGDLLDVGIYLDADEHDIRAWFVARFLELARHAHDDPGSFFARWSALQADEVRNIAEVAWDQINGVNLASYILPTRQRADIVLVKGADHRVREVLVDPTLL